MKCRVCKTILRVDNWYPANKKHGSIICKTCSNAKGTAWKRKHPEKSREYARRYYKTHPKYNVAWCRQNRIDIRKEMIEAYGGKCAICGISDSIVLDIDHIDNSGAKDRRKGMWGWRLYRWLRKNNYPKDNFQLLCKNCNWMKHIKNKHKGLEIISLA